MSATIILTGRLARDPELRTTNTGTNICEMTIPNDSGYGDNKTTTWWKVVIFGKDAVRAGDHLQKGSWISVAGQPSVREYSKRDGTSGWSAEVKALSWDFVGSKGDNNAGIPEARAQHGRAKANGFQPEPADPFGDGVPF